MADRYWRGGTGTWDGSNTANWASTSAAANFTASRSGSTLTVSAVASGTIAVGDTVWHTNGTSIGTITALGTGTGGTGTYTMSASGTVSSRTMVSATVGASVPTSADSVFFDADSNVGTASFTVTTATSTANCLDFDTNGIDAAMTFTMNIGLNVYGNYRVTSNYTHSDVSSVLTFAATSSKTITTNGRAISSPITFDGVGGTWTLQDAFTSSTRTSTLTNGTIDLNNFTYTAGLFVTNNSNTRTIAFGTGKIVTSSNFSCGDGTNFNITGTPIIQFTGASITCNIGGTAAGYWIESTVLSMTVGTPASTAGIFLSSSTTSISANARFLDFNLTGLTNPTINAASRTYFGNFNVPTGTTFTGGTGAQTFASTSSKTITTNGVTWDSPITFNGVGGTWVLQDALTVGATRATTLTNGTLNINNFTLTTGVFSSSNTNSRTLAFGTGKIAVVSGANFPAAEFATSTNLSISGTPRFELSSAAAGIRLGSVAQGYWTEANSLDVNVAATASGAGVYINTAATGIQIAGFYNNVDLSGAASGTPLLNLVRTIYGNFTLRSGMTISAGTNSTNFRATSGTKTITMAGVAFDNPVTFDGVGGTWQLQDALTNGATRTVTLTNGTLDLNTKTLTTGLFASSNSNTRTLTLTNSSVVLTGTGTVWNTATVTGLTFNSSGSTITTSSASTKTFSGDGLTYGTLIQGGAGALTVDCSGATFANIQNTVSPTTVTFTSGQTVNFSAFSLSGTAGNLVTINATTPGSAATLSKSSGTVNVSYCTISDSIATGGATWNAYTSNGNVNGGGNTGWIFYAPQTLTPSLYTNTNSFYLTVLTANYAIGPPLYTNSNAFYSATVTATYTLTPARYNNTNTFYSATVTPGAVNIAPALYTNTNTFYTATVTATYALTPALYTNSNTFYSATVTPGTVTLLPARYDNANAFYSATVTRGAVNLTPALYTNNNSFYSPTVTRGAVNLTPALYTNTNTFYTATVSTAYTLAPTRYDNASIVYDPLVTTGQTVIAPNLYINDNSFYTPIVGGLYTLYPDLYTNVNYFYSASVQSALRGDQNTVKLRSFTERGRF